MVPMIPFFQKTKLCQFVIFLLLGCTEPVAPDFQFEEGLIFIEGFATTQPGASYVTVSESVFEVRQYTVRFTSGASVSFMNLETGEQVVLSEVDGQYVPASDFVVEESEEWQLMVVMPNGVRYASTPEKVLPTVPITNLEVNYDPELEFREFGGGQFIPGHRALVSFNDPSNRENFYYWTYRTLENLDFCEQCFDGYFRDGECVVADQVGGLPPYYLYLCDTECWRIRYPEKLSIFNDRFTNGKTVTDLVVGNLPLYTNENLVLEVRQFSINAQAYDYYKILKDIVENNAGFNAPPPAPLLGNMSNPDNPDEQVFGLFTAASSSTATIFVDRSAIGEPTLESKDAVIFEEMFDPVPEPLTTFVPCLEGRFRTGIRPGAWNTP